MAGEPEGETEVPATALLASVVANLKPEKIQELITTRVYLIDFPVIEEMVREMNPPSDLLNGLTSYDVFRALQQADDGKAGLILSTPGGWEWIGGNIKAAQEWLAKNGTPAG